MKRYLLIDGNSISHAANAGTTLTVGETEVQAIYGVMRTMRKLMSVYAFYTPIVLWDGASWRKVIYSAYKENRDKTDKPYERAQVEAKDSLKRQSAAIQQALKLLGITQVHAFNMEADDLAGIMVDRYEAQGAKIILVSGDKDWIQLISDSTFWFDPIRDRKVTMLNLKEEYGVETPRQFLEMKALMGDTGDNIPGVGGIGAKGAVEFLTTYGSWANFSNMVMDGTIDLKSLPKKYRDLVETEEKQIAFSGNLILMDLRTVQRPEPINLKVTKGEPDAARLRTFCERLLFKSFLKNFDDWIAVFPSYKTEAAA